MTLPTEGVFPDDLPENASPLATDWVIVYTPGSKQLKVTTLAALLNADETSIAALTAAVTALQAAVPWSGDTFALVSQLKAQLVAGGQFLSVQNAIEADPTQAATQQWNSGSIATPTGPLGTLIQTTLGLSSDQMTTLFDSALALPF